MSEREPIPYAAPQTASPPPAPPQEMQDPHRASPVLVAIIVLAVGIVIGLAAGARWHDKIGHLFGMHSDASGAKKQLWTCGMHPQVIQDKPGLCPICGMALEPVDSDAGAKASTSQSNAIFIDPVIVQNMGVRVAKASKGAIEQNIRAVGYLEEAQPNLHDVNLRVSGWIEKLHATTEGMHVTKGQALFDLYSAEVYETLGNLITARKTVGGLPAGADESTRRLADMTYQSTRQKLENWGIDPKDLDEFEKLERAPRTVTFRSPIDGDIVEKMVVQGASVEAGMRVLRIVDHSTLWLDAQVHAQDLPSIKIGQTVTAIIEGVAGKQFDGEVIFIHPHVDTMTRTAKVRMAVPNPDKKLRPGMYATIQIMARLADDALQVPREAIIDTGTRQMIFVAREDGHFEPRPVRIGVDSHEGNVQIIDGLKEGESVVTSGQFLIDAESRMTEARAKHVHGGLLTSSSGPAEDPHAKHGAAPATQPAKSFGHGHWTGQVNAVVSAYLELAEKLGAPQESETPVDGSKLETAAKGLVEHVPSEELKPVVEAVANAAGALGKQPIDQQRKQFRAVSDAVIALVDRLPPSNAVGAKLYVTHCSMAPGTWLQKSADVANPYYATAMKRCGEVQREISLAAEK